ncbi:MAG: SDR family oxidoreductase [Clostridia bacterium]|nr:SDR family oxidoreductase [Clostridia bacterium]
MKKILVSGGSRGIGEAIVKSFSEKGDKVAFIYCKNDKAANCVAEKYGAYAVKADISDFCEAERAYRQAETWLGGIDVLVNCAGVSLIAQICDTDAAAWSRVINTNLSGAYALCRCASVDMVNNKSGVIINIGSVWGRVGASCESAYSASKAGLRGLTLSLAKELAPSGVRVNCVEPGVINTEMNAELGEATLEALTEDIPISRLGEGGDVARLVDFLSGEGASYITGQIIGVDGGFYL